MVAIPDPSRIRAVLDPSPVESDSDWQTLPPAPAAPILPEDDPTNPMYVPPVPDESEWPVYQARPDRTMSRNATMTDKMWQRMRYLTAIHWAKEDEKAGVRPNDEAEARKEAKRAQNREAVARWRDNQRAKDTLRNSPEWQAARKELDDVEALLLAARQKYTEAVNELAVIKTRVQAAQQRLIQLER